MSNLFPAATTSVTLTVPDDLSLLQNLVYFTTPRLFYINFVNNPPGEYEADGVIAYNSNGIQLDKVRFGVLLKPSATRSTNNNQQVIDLGSQSTQVIDLSFDSSLNSVAVLIGHQGLYYVAYIPWQNDGFGAPDILGPIPSPQPVPRDNNYHWSMISASGGVFWLGRLIGGDQSLQAWVRNITPEGEDNTLSRMAELDRAFKAPTGNNAALVFYDFDNNGAVQDPAVPGVPEVNSGLEFFGIGGNGYGRDLNVGVPVSPEPEYNFQGNWLLNPRGRSRYYNEYFNSNNKLNYPQNATATLFSTAGIRYLYWQSTASGDEAFIHDLKGNPVLTAPGDLRFGIVATTSPASIGGIGPTPTITYEVENYPAEENQVYFGPGYYIINDPQLVVSIIDTDGAETVVAAEHYTLQEGSYLMIDNEEYPKDSYDVVKVVTSQINIPPIHQPFEVTMTRTRVETVPVVEAKDREGNVTSIVEGRRIVTTVAPSYTIPEDFYTNSSPYSFMYDGVKYDLLSYYVDQGAEEITFEWQF